MLPVIAWDTFALLLAFWPLPRVMIVETLHSAVHAVIGGGVGVGVAGVGVGGVGVGGVGVGGVGVAGGGTGVGWHTFGFPEQMSGISAQQGGLLPPHLSPSTPHGGGVGPARTGVVSPKNSVAVIGMQSR